MNPPAPRQLLRHAAVAAGGASAALMSFSITCADEAELRAAADECLELALQAALRLIEAAGVLPGELERARLKLAIEDYVQAPVPQPGRCRVCGCTESAACIGIPIREGVFANCSWADPSRTLCNNPECMARAGVTP